MPIRSKFRSDALNACLACSRADLVPILDLGMQPLANNYHDGSTDLLRYPLIVQRCASCTHTQLTHAVPPDVMFRDYAYVSGTSATLRADMQAFAEQVVFDFKYRKAIKDRPGAFFVNLDAVTAPRVLDIACNDGTLMEAFIAEGCTDVFGVDPAENMHTITQQKGLDTLCAYWGSDATSCIDWRADIVTAFNVLAHVSDPLAFLRACALALAPGGRIIVQTSQAHWLERGEFDYWYHEHLSSFTEQSLEVLARRAGLVIERHDYPAIHGTSRRTTLRAPYRDLALAAQQTARDLATTVQALREDGYMVIGYGASAKGNTLLNYARIDLEYIVDDNPGKWGKRTPGRDILIVSPEHLSVISDGSAGGFQAWRHAPLAPLAIVLLAWNFADEIIAKVKALRGDARTVFVYPFPVVKVVE